MTDISKLNHIKNTQKGEPLNDVGCEEHLLEEKIELAKSINSKPIRAVKNWKKLILKLPIEVEKELREAWQAAYNFQLPAEIAIVYASYVISDNSYYLNVGDWVRTTYIYKLYDNCIVETKNTNYILVGAGIQQELGVDEAELLFNVQPY